MFVLKVYCKIETSPWALTLTELIPETFELPASDRPGKKNIFCPISEGKQPGDSRVSLHDVVSLIERHSCVARSTGNGESLSRKVSEVVQRTWAYKNVSLAFYTRQ